MGILKIAGLVGAIWFSASILVAIGWAIARNAGWRGIR